eukprot:760687-Hanusia_phi.AAC.2
MRRGERRTVWKRGRPSIRTGQGQGQGQGQGRGQGRGQGYVATMYKASQPHSPPSSGPYIKCQRMKKDAIHAN